MFLCGSDDCDVEVVVPRNPEDINAINQLVALTQGRAIDNIKDLISDAHIGQHIVICWSYDHDWAWLVTEEKIKNHWDKIFGLFNA